MARLVVMVKMMINDDNNDCYDNDDCDNDDDIE